MRLRDSNFFETHCKILKNIKKIFCGFSGGADSTALLIMLKKYSDKLGFELKAVHFQHGLRGAESIEDSKYCAQFCENRNIDFIEINIDVKSNVKGDESFEDGARRLRLANWKTLCSDGSCAAALGHNSDDRNENMIIRLLRGSNVSGVTSLREIQYLDGIMILRPLLNYSRAEIEDCLKGENISIWREDSSNANNKILRNYIRNIALPDLSDICEGAREGMRRAATALLDDAFFIETEAEKVWEKLSGQHKNLSFIPLHKFTPLNNAIKIRVLRKWLSSNLGKDYIPGCELLNRIEDACGRVKLLADKNRIKIPLPDSNGIFIEAAKSGIAFAKNTSPPSSIFWNWKKMPRIRWGIWNVSAEIKTIFPNKNLRSKDEFSAIFEKKLFPEKLKISPALSGDKMIPFGMDKEVSLKKLFENKKISSEEKHIYPVFSLPENEKIIWLGGIRRSNFAPVEKNNNSVCLKITRYENEISK